MEKYEDFRKAYTADSLTRHYADFRPPWSEDIFQSIVEFCKTTSDHFDLALDVGCGPGISTLPLTHYYKEVIGLDTSAQQISNTPRNQPGVTFRRGEAEHLSFLDDNSVDLVTCGDSVHWLQLDRFYEEVRRVLKPGGTFAAYGYHNGMMAFDNKDVHKYIKHIHYSVLEKYWPEEPMYFADSRYTLLPAIFKKWHRHDGSCLEAKWTPDHLTGLINTWSAVHAYNSDHPRQSLVDSIREKLIKNCGKPDAILDMKIPVYMVMEHKPVD